MFNRVDAGIQSPYGSREKNVFETGFFGRRGSTAPPGGHQLEQVESEVLRVRDFFSLLIVHL